MDIHEKIKILRTNNHYSQAELAELLFVSESTVQKWEVKKNTPLLKTIPELAKLFSVPIEILVDDTINVSKYNINEKTHKKTDYYENDYFPHKIYDIDLKNNATLHRFTNNDGIKYSAIYIGNDEFLSCERLNEHNMINYWNNTEADILSTLH